MTVNVRIRKEVRLAGAGTSIAPLRLLQDGER